MSATSNFERVAAEAAPVLKTAEPTSVVAVIVTPEDALVMDPKPYEDVDDAIRSYLRMTQEHGVQFADLSPQRFLVTERPDLGDHTYHVTRGSTDSEIVRLG